MSALPVHTAELAGVLPRLRAGDRVLLSGTIYTARDAAHKRLFELLDENKPLPFALRVAEAIVRNGACYFAAVGGAGALIARCIEAAEVIAFDDLGCESIKRMAVRDLPLTVAIDSGGNDLFRQGRAEYRREG